MRGILIIAAIILAYCLIGMFVVSVAFGDIEEAIILIVIWPLILAGLIIVFIGMVLGKLHLNPFTLMRKLGCKLNDFIISKLEE